MLSRSLIASVVFLSSVSAAEPIKVLLARSDLNSDVKQRAEWAIRKLQ